MEPDSPLGTAVQTMVLVTALVFVGKLVVDLLR
jgi:hypothetical protein